MPVYRYQCHECGLQFELACPVSSRDKEQPCLSCDEMTKRMMPEGVNGFFNKDVTGPIPQNTGISGLDAHIDRTIGASAQKGWEAQNKREQEKRRILARSENEGKTLSRNPDGSYRPMGIEERQVQARAHNIHEQAMLRKAKKPSIQ